MIRFHCMLNWVTDGKKGFTQFELPYFMFKPKSGHWTSEDSARYRTDDEAIAQMTRDFNQIVRTGELTFPVPARETEAVRALQEAHQGGRTVNVSIGLLQSDNHGRSKPVRVGCSLTDARVIDLYTRSFYLDGVDTHGYVAVFKAPSPKKLISIQAPV